MVTVVDSLNFFKDFGSSDMLIDRELTDIEGDYRTIVNLLTDQIEFANVIILNKTDLVTAKQLGIIKTAIQKLNPSAKIIESSFSKVEPKEILNTGLFDFEEAEQGADWIEELNNDVHTPETEEYGITSFVYRKKRPFNPKRFWNYVQQNFPNTIIRSKGLFWLASRPDQALIWNQAGSSLDADSAGVWWSSMSFENRMENLMFMENKNQIEEDWHKEFGDRKNELVFIGQDMDENQIVVDLNSCLSTDEELSSGEWKSGYDDDLPVERAFALD